jgi:CMP/dCMP kinase
MTVITLTGDLGSMGSIARLTAQHLGYDLLEPELTVQAAAALTLSEPQLEAFGERTGGLGPRFVARLREYLNHVNAVPGRSMFAGGEVEEVMSRTYGDVPGFRVTADDQRYFDALRRVVTYFAELDNIVMVGRGAQLILADKPDAVHVRVFCPIDERVRRVRESDGRSLEDVRLRVEDSDRDRDSWHRKFFDADYQRLEQYHAVVNSSRMSDETAARLIIEIVRQVVRND